MTTGILVAVLGGLVVIGVAIGLVVAGQARRTLDRPYTYSDDEADQ